MPMAAEASPLVLTLLLSPRVVNVLSYANYDGCGIL